MNKSNEYAKAGRIHGAVGAALSEAVRRVPAGQYEEVLASSAPTPVNDSPYEAHLLDLERIVMRLENVENALSYVVGKIYGHAPRDGGINGETPQVSDDSPYMWRIAHRTTLLQRVLTGVEHHVNQLRATVS